MEALVSLYGVARITAGRRRLMDAMDQVRVVRDLGSFRTTTSV